MSNSKIWKCAKKEIFRHFVLGRYEFPMLHVSGSIYIKDLSSSPSSSCGIRDLRGSRGSATQGERQSLSKARNKVSLHSVDAEQILFAWQASELSSPVHEEVKESEPPRDPKFELGLHEAARNACFKAYFCIKMAHAKMCQVFLKYEY